MQQTIHILTVSVNNSDFEDDYEIDGGSGNGTQTERVLVAYSYQGSPHQPASYPNRFCGVYLYEDTDIRGNGLIVRFNVPILGDKSFDNSFLSFKIDGPCCWEMYENAYYR